MRKLFFPVIYRDITLAKFLLLLTVQLLYILFVYFFQYCQNILLNRLGLSLKDRIILFAGAIFKITEFYW